MLITMIETFNRTRAEISSMFFLDPAQNLANKSFIIHMNVSFACLYVSFFFFFFFFFFLICWRQYMVRFVLDRI